MPPEVMSENPEDPDKVLCCHWYVIGPSPVAALDVSKAGVEDSQMIWLAAIEPAEILLIVILIGSLGDEHGTPQSVQVTIRRYQVS